eukprot:m.265050 g.265050  ORF g.265050 m.265050 type:complete len:112 (-) comp11057_c0_seq9:8-343(-)
MLREQCIQHVMCCCVLASQNPHECPRCISLSCPAGAVDHFSGSFTAPVEQLFEFSSQISDFKLNHFRESLGLLPAFARVVLVWCLLPFSEILQSARLRWSGGIPGSEATVS